MRRPNVFLVFFCCNIGFSDSSNSLTRFLRLKPEEGEVKRSIIIGECISHILNKNVTVDEELVAIFSGDEDVNRSWTEGPTVVMTEGSDSDVKYKPWKRDFVIVFSDLPLPDILKKVSWRSATKFIVSHRKGSTTKEILSVFWERRIVNVDVLVPKFPPGNVQVFTFFVYSERHCEGLGEIVSLGECPDIIHFFPEKVSNLHGCPLMVTLVERSPAVINNKGVADGVETEILKMIAGSLNATPTFYFLKGRLRFYSTNGNSVLLELLENRSHMVAGSLIYTESVHLLSEGIEYPVAMCITVIVPRVTRPSYLHIFENIIAGEILAGVVVNIAFGIVCTYAFLKVLDPRTNLKTAAQPILDSPKIKFYYVTVRLFLAFWLLTSFLLNTVFEASVSSSVLAPKPLPQLESLEDVFENDLLLDGDSFIMKEVLPSYLPRRRKNEICGCKLKKALTLIAEEGDRAFIDIKFNVMYNLMELPRISPKIHIPEKCILTFRPVIQLRKHSPFSDIVRKFMLSLSESGIISKSFDTYNRRITEKKGVLQKRLKPLTVSDFKGSFLLLLLGLAASSLIFTLEILSFTFHRFGQRILHFPLGILQCCRGKIRLLRSTGGWKQDNNIIGETKKTLPENGDLGHLKRNK